MFRWAIATCRMSATDARHPRVRACTRRSLPSWLPRPSLYASCRRRLGCRCGLRRRSGGTRDISITATAKSSPRIRITARTRAIRRCRGRSSGWPTPAGQPTWQVVNLLRVQRLTAGELVEGHRIFDVNPEADYVGWSSSLVVTRVCHVLIVGGDGNTAPEVRGVIGLEDLLQAVVQPSVTENKSAPS